MMNLRKIIAGCGFFLTVSAAVLAVWLPLSLSFPFLPDEDENSEISAEEVTLPVLPPKRTETTGTPAAGTGTPNTPAAEKLSLAGCPEGFRPSQRDFGDEPFDPERENGKFFDGWEKPAVTLVLTGRLNGYMEPCGCAGLERMKGGLSRRATFLDDLRRNEWDPVALDTGGVSVGFSQQAKLKYQTTVNMLREMDYSAITLGTSDLNFPSGDILSEISTPSKSGNMFVSANVGVFAFDSKTLPPAKIIQRNGVKIGVIGVLGDSQRDEVRNDELIYLSALNSLKKVVPALKKNCDFVVLLAHATEEETREYAKALPEIDIVVTSDGPPVPPANMEVIQETGQYYITVGEKGTHLITLGIYRDNRQPVRYQRVALDSRYKPSQKFVNLMALYQDQLTYVGLEGLGIRSLRNPFLTTGGDYVGSARCEPCHEDIYIKWQKTRHGKAWKPLREASPPRTADPECVACHVVGWNVEHFTPYVSGFLSAKETPNLMNVGCEACHGPGTKHIAAELGKDTKLQAQFRKTCRVSLEEAKKTLCVTCHDLDNSPNFDFDLYWKCIEHKNDADE